MDKYVTVFVEKGMVEQIDISEPDLTVGWLISEVTRRYNEHYKHKIENTEKYYKKIIVGLKSIIFYPTLDTYLTQLDNIISPIKHKTSLTVHFAKIKSNKENLLHRSNIGAEDFKFIKVIGKGSYSYVAIARKKDSGKLYAVKIMKKKKLFKEVGRETFISESWINKKFKNTPFVIDTYYAFQTKDEMFLVMELCPGGTLFEFLRQMPSLKKLNYDIVRFYIAEIIIALEFVHAKNIMYRDLKPENILIDLDGHIKLSDFGLSKELKARNDLSKTFWGSPEYLAPEMLFGDSHSRSVDFYTLGCLVYEIIVGYPPFYSKNSQDLGKKMMSEELYFPKDISAPSKDLVCWLINKDPTERPNEFSEVKNHIFFENLHWGKLAKKEVIPPFIPDLYTINFDKAFLNLSVHLAFDQETFWKTNSKESVYIQQKQKNGNKTASKNLNKSMKLTRNNENLSPSTPWASRKDKSPMWLESFDFEAHSPSEIMIQKQLKWFTKSFNNTEVALKNALHPINVWNLQ
jgi:serine/threonine protein kinase